MRINILSIYSNIEDICFEQIGLLIYTIQTAYEELIMTKKIRLNGLKTTKKSTMTQNDLKYHFDAFSSEGTQKNIKDINK